MIVTIPALAQMNVSKQTIHKLEAVLSNNEDVKSKLFNLLAETAAASADGAAASSSADTDSLPDPELMLEFQQVRPSHVRVRSNLAPVLQQSQVFQMRTFTFQLEAM